MLTGACWLPVVWLQIRMHRLASAELLNGGSLPLLYFRYARWWFILGWPAFISVIAIFYHMKFQPDL